ncbi:hypothetical protein V6N13_033735 [Hibiscus sabdariffa]|uniref:Uncharacterized protein n=1 Tax=Hibiscus sabdariffa TaxID=183260 RepID=A0ABR2F9R8_9ROSI
MDSRDRTEFYLIMMLLRSFGQARSSLVFYEHVGLKGCFPTQLEDSVEMSTAKGTSSVSTEEGGEKKKFSISYLSAGWIISACPVETSPYVSSEILLIEDVEMKLCR